MVYEVMHGNATHRIHCRVEALSLKEATSKRTSSYPPGAELAPWPWPKAGSATDTTLRCRLPSLALVFSLKEGK